MPRGTDERSAGCDTTLGLRARISNPEGMPFVATPSAPCAYTNIPIIMIAERISDMIIQEQAANTATVA